MEDTPRRENDQENDADELTPFQHWIGNLIARASEGYSQAGLAAMIGVSHSALCTWKFGEKVASPAQLRALARAYARLVSSDREPYAMTPAEREAYDATCRATFTHLIRLARPEFYEMAIEIVAGDAADRVTPITVDPQIRDALERFARLPAGHRATAAAMIRQSVDLVASTIAT